MVVRLAESMELTLRERNELLLAAGFAPVFPESPLDDETLRPVRQALYTILEGHLPYPTIVVRPHGILVAANRAFDVFHEGVDPALLTPPVNVFRLALHPDGLARRVRNLPEWGRHVTGNLRTKFVRSPDPSLEALLTELEGYLPPTRVECAPTGGCRGGRLEEHRHPEARALVVSPGVMRAPGSVVVDDAVLRRRRTDSDRIVSAMLDMRTGDEFVVEALLAALAPDGKGSLPRRRRLRERSRCGVGDRDRRSATLGSAAATADCDRSSRAHPARSPVRGSSLWVLRVAAAPRALCASYWRPEHIGWLGHQRASVARSHVPGTPLRE